MGDLAHVLTECSDKDFMLECLGVLANLSVPDLDYSQVFQQFRLIPWVRTNLVPGKSIAPDFQNNRWKKTVYDCVNCFFSRNGIRGIQKEIKKKAITKTILKKRSKIKSGVTLLLVVILPWNDFQRKPKGKN